MDAAWDRFLDGTAPAAHAVHLYEDTADLADTVAAYLSTGFAAGEPAIVVATPEHAQAFAERLAGQGFDERLLVVADAESTLAAILDGERPARQRFEHVIGG